jgi:hypothetical protein
MFGVRLVGTNKWILRIPGHSKVVEGAGSTWTKDPGIDFYNQDIFEHICNLENIKHYKAENIDQESGAELYWASYEKASDLFYANKSKYLEVVKVEFKEIT